MESFRIWTSSAPSAVQALRSFRRSTWPQPRPCRAQATARFWCANRSLSDLAPSHRPKSLPALGCRLLVARAKLAHAASRAHRG
jgi:hypothetical protein